MTTPIVVKFTKPSPTSLTMEVLQQDTNLIPRGDFSRSCGEVPVMIGSSTHPDLPPCNGGTIRMWVRGKHTQQDNRVGVANFNNRSDRDAALAAFAAAVTELNATLSPTPPPTDDHIVIVGTL